MMDPGGNPVILFVLLTLQDNGSPRVNPVIYLVWEIHKMVDPSQVTIFRKIRGNSQESFLGIRGTTFYVATPTVFFKKMV